MRSAMVASPALTGISACTSSATSLREDATGRTRAGMLPPSMPMRSMTDSGP
jgi:hypothetical protein